MIAGLSAAGNASANARGPAGDAANGAADAGASGFDRLLDRPATGTRANANANEASLRPGGEKVGGDEGSGDASDVRADAAAGKDTATGNRAGDREDGTPDEDADLPDRLLALIGGWHTGQATPAPPPGGPGMPGTAGTPGALALPGTVAAGTAVAPAMAAAIGADGLTNAAAMPGATAGSGLADASAAGAAIALPVADPTAAGAAAATTAGAALPENFGQWLQAAATEPGATDSGDGPQSTTTDLRGLTASTATGVTAATARASAAATAPLMLPADPDAGFDDSFGARIGWMAEQRIGHAELRLNPEQLGTIEVRLQMDGTRVSAEFQSPHADVRQALESSIGRLRDMLGQQGLELAHSDVGQGRGDGRGGDGGDGSAGTDAGHGTDTGDRMRPAVLPTRGLLDEYA